MAFARAADGARLHYDATDGGPGSPAVLLVMGLGFRGEIWSETRDALAAADYLAITMDNRGVGASDRPSRGFTTATMADDAIAVLDAVGVPRAHVVGTSLGGMVAQQLALRHASRVDALVLQSTSAGLPRVDFVPFTGPFRAMAMVRARRRDAPPDERARVALRLTTTSRYARTADLADPRVRLYLDAMEGGVDPLGYLAQIRAASRHRTWPLLHRIASPTLVQHGARDRVVRAAAGRAIAARIPGARLEVYARAGHFLALQRPDSLDALVAFLRANDVRS